MISSLQSWRFIFAIMIFLHHFPVDGTGLFKAGGSCGVSFFIILSGFVMSAGYGNRCRQRSFIYWDFLEKRLVRLYPLHLLCLILFVFIRLFSSHAPEWGPLIPNLLLVQSWIPDSEYYFSGNAVSWCLADMLFFYVSFPLLIRFVFICKKRLCLFLFGVFLLYFTALYFTPAGKVHALFYIFPLSRLVDFIIGMLLYHVYQYVDQIAWINKLKRLSYTKKTLIECMPIVLLILALLFFPLIDQKIYVACYYWFPMSFLILLFAIFNKNGGGVTCLLTNKAMLYWGSISFSFYMLHLLIINTSNALLSQLGITLLWEYKLPLYLLFALIASILISKYYEQPIVSFYKKKVK